MNDEIKFAYELLQLTLEYVIDPINGYAEVHMINNDFNYIALQDFYLPEFKVHVYKGKKFSWVWEGPNSAKQYLDQWFDDRRN